MAVYPPPNYTEYISTFNTSNWEETGDAITPSYLNKRYLKFPVAQGTETLVDTIVNGALTVNNGITFPNSNTQRTAPITRSVTLDSGGSTYTFTNGVFGAFNILTSTFAGASRTVNLPVATTPYLGSAFTILNDTVSIINLYTNGVTIYYTGIYGNDQNTVQILPQQQLTFYWDGSGYQIITKVGVSPNYLTTGATWDFSQSCFIANSTLIYSFAGDGAITLPNFSASATNSGNNLNQLFNSVINVTNSSPNILVLTSLGGNFAGRFGTGSTTFIVFPNQSVQLFCDSQNSTYDVEYKSGPASINLTYTQFLAVLTAGRGPSYLDSTITLTGSSATTFTPFPSASLAVGKVTRIYNEGSANITLSSSSTFAGSYGTNTTSLIMPDSSWIELTSDGTNWLVMTRSDNPLFLRNIGGGVDYSTDYSLFDSTLSIMTSGVTVTIPPPSVSHSHNYFLVNRGSVPFTILISSGSFIGPFGGLTGGGVTSTIVPKSCFLKLYSNGVSWYCYDRGVNSILPLTLTTTTFDISSFNYYTNCTLQMTSTSNCVLTIPPASQLNHTTTYENNSANTITLSVASGVFAGTYGTGTTTYQIPAGAWVTIAVSSGTNYDVLSRSEINPQIFINTSLDLSTNFYYCETETIIQAPDGGINTLALSGTASQSGNTLTVVTNTGAPISIGSVLSVSGVRVVILRQINGTVGQAGTYTVGGPQTLGTVPFTGFANPNALAEGTLTATAFQTTRLPTVTINTFTSGSGTLGGGSVICNFSGANPTYYQYITDDANSGGLGTYNVCSSVGTGNITGGLFYSTQGNRIILPLPSNAVGRKYRFLNNNILPVFITTTGGTNVFGGRWGQQIANFTSIAYSNNYLLRPGKIVELISDGTYWNAEYATTGIVFFINSTGTATSGTDGSPATLTNYCLLDCNDANNTGLTFNAARNAFVNQTNYTIDFNININLLWGNPAVTSTTALPMRQVTVARVSGNNLFPVNYNSGWVALPNITLSGSNFVVPASNQFNQSFNANFLRLYPGESFSLTIAKINGGIVSEQVSSACVFGFQRIN